MTDFPETENNAPRHESYRLCGACGVLMRRDTPVCPECGAEAGEDHSAESTHNHETGVFTFMIVLILLGTLALLSQNRETALEIENQRLLVLAPIDPASLFVADPEPEPAAPVPQPTPPSQPEPEVAGDAFDDEAPFDEEDSFDDEDSLADTDPFGEPDAPESLEPPESEPAPPTRAERIQMRRAELIEEYTRVLDENHPMFRTGERITLRLNDGTSHTGVFQQFAGGQVQIRLPSGESRRFVSRQLAPESRVRVDPSERQALVQERAWEEALREMQDTP